jgi:hypothetical protein
VIRYRDYWFWIDDRDLPSKGVYSFLMFLFTLTESGGGQVSPVLTVPAPLRDQPMNRSSVPESGIETRLLAKTLVPTRAMPPPN